MTSYADLADYPEDTRIEAIGKAASAGNLVAFVVDDDEKADRYIKLLLERFKVRVADRGAGPVANTVMVRIGPLRDGDHRLAGIRTETL